MGKYKKKPVDRILAAALSAALTTCLTPMSVFAEGDDLSAAVHDTLDGKNDTSSDGTDASQPSIVPVDSTDSKDAAQMTEAATEAATESTTETATEATTEAPPSVQYALNVDVSEEIRKNVRIRFSNKSPEDISKQEDISDTTYFTVSDDDKVTLLLNFYDDKSHFFFTDVKIAGEDVELTEKEIKIGNNTENVYAYSFEITEEMLKKASDDGKISVEFDYDQISYITLSYDANKGIVTSVDSDEALNGTITLNKDESLEFIVTPAENYRVASVNIDGKVKAYKNNDQIVTIKDLEVNKDHEITVVFSLNRYKITASGSWGGFVEPKEHTADHGSDFTFKVSPVWGFYIDSLTVDGEDAEDYDVDKEELTISNITSDHSVNAVFSSIVPLSDDNLSWNSDEAIEDYIDKKTGEHVYVFSKGKKVEFTSNTENAHETPGIKLNCNNGEKGSENAKSITITENTTINGFKLYYRENEYSKYQWREKNFDEKIRIEFYEGPVVGVKLPPLEEGYTVYSEDVDLKLNIDVPEGDYPEIAEIRYRVGDEEEWTVLSDPTARKIVIDAKKYEMENIVVHVEVEDSDGHIGEADSECFSISDVIPIVEVEIDGEPYTGADAGVFNGKRTATVTIHDKSYTFVLNDLAFIIKKNGKVLNFDEMKPMISWDNKDQGYDDHVITIVFEDDAVYEWYVDYKNSAGNHNEGIECEDDETIFNFTIDKKAPTGKIFKDKIEDQSITTDEEKTWDTPIYAYPDLSEKDKVPENSAIFNIFKKSDIEIKLESEDKNGSGVKSMMYYKDIYNTDLQNITEPVQLYDDLEKLYKAGKFIEYNKAFKISPQEKAVIYLRVMDRAGNVTYISSDGMIVDNQKPEAVSIKTDEDTSKGIQNRKVIFDITVKDTIDVKADDGKKAYSGIKRVYYTVEKDGDVIYNPDNDLYNWSEDEKALRGEWKGTITIDPSFEKADFNQDDLNVVIYAEDNAGNILKENKYVSINTDKIVVNVSFDEDKFNDNRLGDSYFTSRTATFKFRDRSSAFIQKDAEAAIIASISATEITSADGTLFTKAPEDLVSVQWLKSNDPDEHIAKVTFNYCGNYTLKNSSKSVYKNKAGNQVNVIGKEEKFTIDTVAPNGSFSTINGSTWDKLLNVLTFGIYTSNKYTVTAESTDKTSPTVIDYYISHESTPLSSTKLDKITGWKRYDKSFEIGDPEKYVVYLRITDGAGNYTYICSDGHIIDTSAPSVNITPEAPVKELNGKRVYNASYKGGVSVDIEAKEAAPYSGLKSVEYWVEADGKKTQEGVLYSFTSTSPSYGELKTSFKTTVKVDAAKNNSSNVVLYVKSVDNAGNVTIKNVTMDIDITLPVIEVSYDNNSDNNGNTYFDEERTATVVITERSNHFSAVKATDGITITAVDVDGNNVSNGYVISNWTVVKGSTPDQDTHIATITYSKDANYTFDISYTDEVGNKNSDVITGSSTAPYKFTVDTVKPTGSIKAVSDEGAELEWEDILDDINFGFQSNSNINITGSSDDETSPIASVEYYKTSSHDAGGINVMLSEDELNGVSSWQPFYELDIEPNEQAIVYLKITDMAGNVKYVGTNGMIVDNTSPRSEFSAPEINITPEQTESGIYSGDVEININVDDPMVGGTYSGLKSIRYRVLNMGTETQSGMLYEFDSEAPKQDDLLRSWDGSIVVNSELNNSNDVVIEIYAEDNANNSSSKSISIQIDKTAPVINVAYENNTSNGKLYKNSRTAKISVTERNFHEDYVNILVNGERRTASWTSSGGTGNGDDTVWYAEVPFTSDGDYTFDISCTDRAANKSGEVNYGDSTNPKSFTVDATSPVISVDFTEGDNPHEGNYFQKARKAQITIDELHFDPKAASEGVKCLVNVDIHDVKGNKEAAASEVVLSSWTQLPNTNRYVATMDLTENAQYTLNISYTDEAGNAASSYSSGFYIDTVDPSLSVSVNGSEKNGAYSDKIEAKVSFEDTNINSDTVKITMKGANIDVSEPKIEGDELTFVLTNDKGKTIEWKGKFENITKEGSNKVYGRTLTFDNFPTGSGLKDFDDIYTISAEVTDKSGRSKSKELMFSVNRYGSTYDISKVKDILGTYTKNPPSIVISEVNPDELKEYTVTLFKNNETITLVEGQDYTVEITGGPNKWYEYIYNIPESNFKDDGIYSITIHSVDKANNVSENTLDTKESEISFVVDNTPPKALVANIENGKTYAENSRHVIMTADDNILLSKIVVYLDGSSQPYVEWSAEEIEAILKNSNEEEREFSFDINGDSTKPHTLKIVCTDAAGNETELNYSGFYITTNMWIRFINNKPVLIGSIAGVLAAIGGIIFFIVNKKKRRR